MVPRSGVGAPGGSATADARVTEAPGDNPGEDPAGRPGEQDGAAPEPGGTAPEPDGAEPGEPLALQPDGIEAALGSEDPTVPPPVQEASLRAVGRSAAILTGGTFAVQAIGILRELFIAAQVGLSRDLDALLIAMVLPTTLAGVLTSGIVTAMVPAYVEAREKGGRPLARRLSGAVLAWIGLAGIAVSVLLVVFANPIISIAGPGLDAASHDGAVQYLYVMAPVAFLAAVSGILYALCQAEDLFASIAIGSFVGTVTTFVIMLLLWGSLNLMALAVGTLIGQLVGVVILLVATARASAAPSLTLRSKGLELGAFLRHAAPLTLSSAILQVNVVFDRAIASLIAPGGVSALRYAEVLVRTPISAISPAWGSAMYPTLVRAARDRDNSLASTTSRSLRFAIGVFVPIAMLTAAVAPVAVAVAYGRGAFTPLDIDRTARVVAGFAPLIVVLMTSPVLAGAHNARRTGVVLLAGGITNVTTNVILDVVFGAWLGVAGIALASSVSTTIVAVFFAWRLASVDRAFTLRPIGRVLGLAVSAAAVPVAIVAAIAWSGVVPSGLLVELLALGLFGLLGLGGFVLVARLVGLEEPLVLIRALRGVLDRRRAPGAA